MLFNDQLLFIHVPKTGGQSVAKFLIDNLPGKIVLTDGPDRPADASVRLPASVRAKLAVKRVLRRWGMWMPRAVAHMEGKRHERLAEAQEALGKLGRQLGDFRLILAVVRNPYDLEVSRYHFLRKGYHGVKGLAHGREQQLAMASDFEQFALKAPFFGKLPARIEDWYEIAGRTPDNLRIARFENLEGDLRDIVGELCAIRTAFPRLNKTPHPPYTSHLTPKAEEAIHNKYRWLFDRGFYQREKM